MTKTTLLKTVIVLLAGVGIALPQQVVAAEKTAPVGQAKSAILDVKLDQQGSLSGYVVDGQGKPQADQKVVIKQGRSAIADVKTDAKGHFEVKGLKGGLYQIESSKGATAYRVWSDKSAPKNSKDYAVVVTGKQIVRAQGELGGVDGGTLLTIGAVGTGIGLGTAGLIEASDANDRADNLQAQIDALNNTP